MHPGRGNEASPLINISRDDLGSYAPIDLNGKPRYFGSHIDTGAYETTT